MSWLYPTFILIGLLIQACFIIALVWLTAKIARGEEIILKKKQPPSPIYDTPEQRNRLRHAVNRTRSTKPIFIGDFWNDGPYVGGCIAGRQYLHINNKGDVEPCAFVHFAVDNIRDKTLKEIMESPFFRAFRERQNAVDAPRAHNANMLTPCCVIDQPWVLREIVKEHRAHPTDGSGDLLRGPLARALDEYSKKIHRIYDPIWEKDYTRFHQKHNDK